jgi:hypothetical protein
MARYDRVEQGCMSSGIKLAGTAVARDGPNYIEYTAVIRTHRFDQASSGRCVRPVRGWG